ncbi:hypothetical protein JCM11641_008445 [Rhodosporidiobolus odoratus]
MTRPVNNAPAVQRDRQTGDGEVVVLAKEDEERGKGQVEPSAPSTSITTTSKVSPPTTEVPSVSSGRDIGFNLPVPSHLRHDPAQPFEFTTFHKWLFAAGATITVSNLYYNQPILVQLSEYYSVPYSTVTRVTSLVQAGYLCGLIFLVPLGDLLPRRPLLLALIPLAATFSIGLALCPTFSGFEALSFLAGFTNVTPQILVPLAADLAHPSKRAASVSIVLSGLLGGMVWGRLFAGVLARFTSSPLHVYWLAAGVQYALFAVMWWCLPVFPRKKTGLNYLQILWSLVKLFFTKPVLFQACFIGLCSCAVMVSWWTSLTFLLSDTPYSYNTFEIGLFGLTGICAVAFAPFAGRLTDRIQPWVITLLALLGQLVTQCIALGGARLNLAPVIICCILVDIMHQTNTIGNQARFFSVDPTARSRVNSVYMAFVFAGQAAGSSAGPHLFLKYGWRACYGLNIALVGGAILVLLARGPSAGDRWIGWGGSYSLRKERVVQDEEKTVVEKEKEVIEGQKVEGFLQEGEEVRGDAVNRGPILRERDQGAVKLV